MAYIDHIRALNSWNQENFMSFHVAHEAMGWIRRDFAEQLSDFPKVFEVNDEEVHLNPELDSFDSRSSAVAIVLQRLFENGEIEPLMGEMFPVTVDAGEMAAFRIDRTVVSRFGIRAFGQHVNGYVETSDGLAMWIARRAVDRRAYPGRLDQLVAGGLPHGISLADNLAKECMEEANMSPALVANAELVSRVSYRCEVDRGLRNDTLFCYDLKLPETFKPSCNDGEVEAFVLMPIEQVAEIVRDSEAFKPNCNLVIIDFLMRYGFISQGGMAEELYEDDYS